MITGKIAYDVISYSLPLVLIAADRSYEINIKALDLILGSSTCHLMLHTFFRLSKKAMLVVSAFLYTAYIFNSSFYFFSYGFIAYQAYFSEILISNRKQVNLLINKLEILGLLISELKLRLPSYIRIGIAILLILKCITTPNICKDSKDPYECIKTKFDSFSSIQKEYKAFLKNEIKQEEGISLFIDILYLISKNRLFLLFCMFFNINLSELFIFPICIFFIFEIPWTFLALFLKSTGKSVMSRFIVTAVICYAVKLVNYTKEIIK